MSNLYLFNYNNYFNRIEKQEANLEAYGTPIYVLENTNFNYNDGVTTSHVINFNSEQGNYVIITDSENNISSRWFVIDHNKTRGGQYNLSLRRDLVIDFYNSLLTAPMIINRAMITNPDNPLLFNTEGFSFNQIKREETTLDDGAESRWYYLYFKKDAPSKAITVNLNENAYDLLISGTIQNYFRYLDQDVSNIKIDKFMFRANCQSPGNVATYNWDFNSNVESEVIGYNDGTASEFHRIDLDNTAAALDYNVKEMLAANYYTLSTSYFADITTDLVTDNEYETWKNLNGKKVKDSTGKIYLVSVTTRNTTDWDYIDYTEQDYPATVSAYINMIETNKDSIYFDDGTNYGTEALRVYTTNRHIFIHVEDITAQSGSLTFNLFDSTGNYVTTNDSEYKIISLPADRCVYSISGDNYIDPIIIQKIIREISLNYPDYLVDIQLLPYCNYHETIFEGTIYPQNISAYQVQYLTHTENNATIRDGFIYYVDSANVSFNLYRSFNIGNYDEDEAKNKKIANEVELWRLVSPNYDGQFEFSVAKNDGVDSFNIDITLKPYNPYIHINPNFKSLYGQDFDDARGLILGGDFSMPIETNAWAEYELRNKNYQIAFNRQIEHLDFTQNQEKILSAINLFGGTLQGGLSGAVGGAMAGGGVPGAIAGGIVGTVGAAATGIADYAMLKSRQREDKDFTIDNWTYQLGNIKALPNSISKVTPLTYNNKKFPFIEKYVATEEEINILKNKIKYNSMNVSAYGTIQEYLQLERTFIQGTIIRLEDNEINNHELSELNNELMKGVYI